MRRCVGVSGVCLSVCVSLPVCAKAYLALDQSVHFLSPWQTLLNVSDLSAFVSKLEEGLLRYIHPGCQRKPWHISSLCNLAVMCTDPPADEGQRTWQAQFTPDTLGAVRTRLQKVLCLCPDEPLVVLIQFVKNTRTDVARPDVRGITEGTVEEACGNDPSLLDAAQKLRAVARKLCAIED